MNKTDLPEIQYTVSPSDPHGHRFQVKLHIAHPDPKGQILQMPAWIPGSYLIRDFSKYIETGLVLRLPSLMVGISLLVAGISLILIGHLLEEQQKSHIATIRQSYLLSLRSKS
jgi:hypothetical protein